MNHMAKVSVLACLLAGSAFAQSGTITRVQRVSFDSPEGWALKYYTSATLMSGLQPPEASLEDRHLGSINVGLELGWLPTLTPERARVGFSGRKEEGLNNATIFVRPVVREGRPVRPDLLLAPPLPTHGLRVTPRLF